VEHAREQGAAKAANLQAYKDQLAEMEKVVGAMLRQLPNRTEVPNLLVDISQTGLRRARGEAVPAAGREPQDFYADVADQHPADRHYTRWVPSRAASRAARIVTLHDLEIVPAGRDARSGGGLRGSLTLNVTAKTYRYLDEEEQEPGRRREKGEKEGHQEGQEARWQGLRQSCHIPAHMNSTGRFATRPSRRSSPSAAAPTTTPTCAPASPRSRSRPGGRIEPLLPEVKALRDVRLRVADSARPSRRAPPGRGPGAERVAPRPEPSREFLEQFSLDTLRMVARSTSAAASTARADQGRAGAPVLPQLHRTERCRITAIEEARSRSSRSSRTAWRVHRTACRARPERLICKETRA